MNRKFTLSPFIPFHCPDTLKSRNNLAAAYLNAGRLDDAIPLFEQALKQREAVLGSQHPDTIKSRNNLAAAYLRAQPPRMDDAIRLFKQAAKEREAVLGPNHPDALVSLANLGFVYRQAGQIHEAIPLLEQALQRGRKLDGGLPHSLAGIPTILAESYNRAGLFAKSETLLRDCLKRSDAKPPDNWEAFYARLLLGAALVGQKKYIEAEPQLLQGYEGMKARQAKMPPQGKIRLTEVMEHLVRMYEAADQKDKAADWRNKLQQAKDAQSKPKR